MRIKTEKYGWTVAGCFLWGTLAHFYILTNILQNMDNAAILPTGFGTGLSSGRWLLTLLGSFVGTLGGNYNLSWFNGIVCLAILTVSCCMVTELAQIRGIHAFLFAGVFITFPTVSSTLFYMYTVIYYALAVLMAVSAVWLTVRYRHGCWAAVALEACSLGIYQAYIPMTAALFVILLIVESVKGEKPEAVVKRAFFYLFVLACGFLLYFWCLRVCLRVTGHELSSYAGVNEMGQVSLSEIPGILRRCYSCYYGLWRTDYHSVSYNRLLKLCFAAAWTAGLVSAVDNWRKRRAGLLNLFIALALYAAVFPLAVNGIEIMCYRSRHTYVLMIYAVAFVFLLPPALGAAAREPGEKEADVRGKDHTARALSGVLTVVLTVAVLSYAYLANIKYTAMFYMNQQTTSYLNELVTRIRSADGYRAAYPLAFIGDEIRDPSFVNPWRTINETVKTQDSEINSYSRFHYMRHYLGYAFQTISESEKEALRADCDIAGMPCYPDDGSIRVFGNVVVVKFSD